MGQSNMKIFWAKVLGGFCRQTACVDAIKAPCIKPGGSRKARNWVKGRDPFRLIYQIAHQGQKTTPIWRSEGVLKVFPNKLLNIDRANRRADPKQNQNVKAKSKYLDSKPIKKLWGHILEHSV